MAEIKGKGVPTRQTKGALGDIYVDSITGIKYKCTGSYGVTTHAESKTDYEWKPVNTNTKNIKNAEVKKPHETPKKQVNEKAVEPVDDAVNSQAAKKESKSNDKHNYTKHFENAR